MKIELMEINSQGPGTRVVYWRQLILLIMHQRLGQNTPFQKHPMSNTQTPHAKYGVFLKPKLESRICLHNEVRRRPLMIWGG